MKALEIAEQEVRTSENYIIENLSEVSQNSNFIQCLQREDSYEETIRDLTQRLKEVVF